MVNSKPRIYQNFERVGKEIIDEFRSIPTPDLSDAPATLPFYGGEMKALHHSGIGMVGSALTVRVPSGDSLMVQKAIDLAEVGDVIVVEEIGESKNALLGDLVCLYAKQKGVEGFIIDGAIRDLTDILKLSMPIYAKDIVTGGANKSGPGEINITINCNGSIVSPGDVIVGDDEGFVIIPASYARETLVKSKEKMKENKVKKKRILNGMYDQTWIDDLLEEKGCEWN